MRVRIRAGLALWALVALITTACAGPAAGAQPLPTAGPAPAATPLPAIQFPADEDPHQSLTEWWYYTGFLQGKGADGSARRYGFELTVFQTLRGRLPPYYIAHYAVTDLGRSTFFYDQRAEFGSRSSAAPSNPGLSLHVGDWTISGADGRFELSATSGGYAIGLTLVDTLPAPVLHDRTGIISYGDAGYSYYYSRPLLGVTGRLSDHGEPIDVTGSAWMDHQWGDFITLAGTGWDWLSLRLDDGSAYMVYVIRDASGATGVVLGTAIGRDGKSTDLDPKGISLEPTGSWTSPRTGAVYPAGWSLRLSERGLDARIEPMLADQELDTSRTTGTIYWEGLVSVTGTVGGKPVAGHGYVELTGYARPSTPVVR